MTWRSKFATWFVSYRPLLIALSGIYVKGSDAFLLALRWLRPSPDEALQHRRTLRAAGATHQVNALRLLNRHAVSCPASCELSWRAGRWPRLPIDLGEIAGVDAASLVQLSAKRLAAASDAVEQSISLECETSELFEKALCVLTAGKAAIAASRSILRWKVEAQGGRIRCPPASQRSWSGGAPMG